MENVQKRKLMGSCQILSLRNSMTENADAVFRHHAMHTHGALESPLEGGSHKHLLQLLHLLQNEAVWELLHHCLLAQIPSYCMGCKSAPQNKLIFSFHFPQTPGFTPEMCCLPERRLGYSCRQAGSQLGRVCSGGEGDVPDGWAARRRRSTKAEAGD